MIVSKLYLLVDSESDRGKSINIALNFSMNNRSENFLHQW